VRGIHAYRDGTSFHLVFSLGSFGYHADQEPQPMGELVYCRDGKDTTIVGYFCENHSDMLLMEETHTPRLVITVHNAPRDLERAFLHLASFCGPPRRGDRKWQGHAENFRPVDSAGRKTLEHALKRPTSNDPPLRVTDISLGSRHACALIEGGLMKCWGDNGYGQLGLGHREAMGDEPSELGAGLPFVDVGKRRVLDVRAGLSLSCALFEGHSVACWGSGTAVGLAHGDMRGDEPGEMGNALSLMIQSGAKAVRVGDYHACALMESGEIRCWGSNRSGVLGFGGKGRFPRPSPVAIGSRARSLEASSHMCAIVDGGALKCWGDNESGQLGQGHTRAIGDDPRDMGRALPTVDLGRGAKVVAVALGGSHTCALLDGGSLKCWGENRGGQLGLGDRETRGDEPGEMGDALPAVDLGQGAVALEVAAGWQHTCARVRLPKRTNVLKCWGGATMGGGPTGHGDHSARGDEPGEMGDALAEVDLGAGRHATRVVAEGDRTCAILDNARLKCWGGNMFGQLGLGDRPFWGEWNDHGDEPGEMGDALPYVEL
jgi:alpha-tubulin suppressor-like RCC1 family protein